MSEPGYQARERELGSDLVCFSDVHVWPHTTVTETPLPRMGADDEPVTNLSISLLKEPSACNSEGLLPFPFEFTGRAYF